MSRTRDHDACPGALQVHQAADGALARVRLPGGMIDAAGLEALADAATRFGAGTLELTSRGNLQVRGVRGESGIAGLADAVTAAGLLPSPGHERVRNIVASPLSGRAGGLADVRPWVAELDRAICAEPELADLPGRFLFSIDDGSADVSGIGADIGVQVMGRDVALLLAGSDTGVRLDPSQTIETLMTLARRFAATRGSAWRVNELADPSSLLAGFTASAPGGPVAPAGPPPVGWIAQDDDRVALGAVVPLGVLTARQAQFVAAVEAPVVITPWRSLVICDLEEGVADTVLRVLAPLGLVFDETSHWLQVSACVGRPGCERSAADVRADAARAVDGTESEAGGGGRVHYAGCDRACGRPPQAKVLVATEGGYRELGRSDGS
ncbi:MAG: precorrin-3B synthase [Mycobacterium sp.]|nr:precorrin-3B synthase [Mycobacterium sp.]